MALTSSVLTASVVGSIGLEWISRSIDCCLIVQPVVELSSAVWLAVVVVVVVVPLRGIEGVLRQWNTFPR